MPFIYHRTVHFCDTDAAGVVYFANALSMCHEAYEASLAAFGIELQVFFNDPEAAIPIIHASVDFLRPLYCGDVLQIHLSPQQLDEHKFEIFYRIVAVSSEQLMAKAMTRHVCIDPKSRAKIPLPEEMVQWLTLA